MAYLWTEFESYLATKLEELPIAGLAIAVSQNGETIYKKGFGSRNLQSMEPVTPETIFGVASITKSLTALAMITLDSEGALSIDDAVIKYLPDFKLHHVKNMSDIKIYHLLSHSTGLAPIARKEEINNLPDHLTHLSSAEHISLGQPGEYFSYCNDTFLLAGAIIEKVTGKLYRRYITEKFLNPLQMYRSTYSLEEVEKYENVTIPYTYNPNQNEYEQQPWPKLGNYEVGGGLRSTVEDLLKYGQVYLDLQYTKDKHPSKEKTLSKMWTNLIKVRQNSFYGYGLLATANYSNVTLVEHGGSQPGVSSHFGFIPEKNVVVAVLCNVSNVPVKDIWLRAVNTVLQLPLEQKRYVLSSYEATPNELESIIGAYSSAEGHHVQIYFFEGQLLAEANGEKMALSVVDNETILINKSGETIQLYFNSNEARPWSILFGMRMLTRI
ncbi:serine hydrolase domain-containing protein [Bacillus horti]|uniref:CubicO group peptidase (Beta-lactamase class C family) n=1 Tax=Caldalkalibacillus horti TaxID=77523 RepID=A0ABT9VY78_9BACI|nr:serine hydrolase domain-containing protein [Bacillus horti]MDQ0165951.1 CubicO group peptidase (beta-lactamase class C family) [Bacillus horti]